MKLIEIGVIETEIDFWQAIRTLEAIIENGSILKITYSKVQEIREFDQYITAVKKTLADIIKRVEEKVSSYTDWYDKMMVENLL